MQATCCEAKSKAAELAAAYRKACAAGKTEEAMRLAMQALAADPMCFAATPTAVAPMKLKVAPAVQYEVRISK
jgi:hypothetical protein